MKEIDPSKEATKKSLAGNTAFDEESSGTEGSWHPVPQRHIDGSGQVEVEILGWDINNESNSASMNISLGTPAGKTIALVVKSSDTIGYLKMKVYDKEGIPPGDQRIMFGGKKLEDDKTLLDYGVHNEAKLFLVLRHRGGGTKICVMKKRVTCKVELLDTVDSLKEKIQEHEGIPPAQQRLTYARKQLEDGHSLSDYGIQREATLDIIITLCGDDMRIPLVEIPLGEILSATKNFNHANIIGKGGSAEVYKGNLRGKVAAIKRLKPITEFEDVPYETKYFGTEVAALGICKHPNIVKMIGYYMDEKERIIVSKYVDGGSLYSRLHAHSPNDAILNWNERMGIALDIASAISYLHEDLNLIHRDLKPQNILLNKNLKVKIADLGVVKSRACDDGEVYTNLIGTQGYLCPVYAQTGSVGTYSDVYAFGVILLELISGRKALHTTTRTLLADWARTKMQDGSHLELFDPHLVGEIEESVLNKVAGLATKCVALSKEDRPSMENIHSDLLSMIEMSKIQSA